MPKRQNCKASCMTSECEGPPALDEIEVSLFGPGYGEAIALHIGEGKWVLVDSCREPDSGLPATLGYLRRLGIDVATAVKLLVATHWHDDHVDGMGALASQCKSAVICVSSALTKREFLQIAALYREPGISRTSGLSELLQIYEVYLDRKTDRARFSTPKLAIADRLILDERIDGPSGAVQAKVFALSPSDAAVVQATVAFRELMPTAGPVRRVASPTPNHASVALWIEIGDHRVLLGADLERTSNPRTGWSAILASSLVVSGRAGVFKVPHHGSESAHHDDVWSSLLSHEPLAALTPFMSGDRSLPTSSDLIRLRRLTPHVYVTAPPRRKRQRWREKMVREFVEQATRSIWYAKSGWGQVRFRTDIGQPDAAWRVRLLGDAYAVSQS